MGHLSEKIERVKIESIAPYAKNYNKHPDSQVNEIARSIERFGFLNPLLVDRDYNIVAGHGRYLAALKLGLENLPVLKATDLTDAERRAYLIADNQIAKHSIEDFDILKDELEDLAGFSDIDLSDIGFSDSELARLLPSEDTKEPKEKSEPISSTSTDEKIKKAILEIPANLRERMASQLLLRGEEPWETVLDELENNMDDFLT